jgi:hypothetical protein
MTIRPLLLAGLLLLSGCSTTIGTTIVADRALPHGTTVEPIGLVSATLWDAHFFWAAPAGKPLYEAARHKALDQKGGEVLINAKVTTTLTSYLMLFYQTAIEIDGTAAKIVPQPETTAGH